MRLPDRKWVGCYVSIELDGNRGVTVVWGSTFAEKVCKNRVLGCQWPEGLRLCCAYNSWRLITRGTYCNYYSLMEKFLFTTVIFPTRLALFYLSPFLSHFWFFLPLSGTLPVSLLFLPLAHFTFASFSSSLSLCHSLSLSQFCLFPSLPLSFFTLSLLFSPLLTFDCLILSSKTFH